MTDLLSRKPGQRPSRARLFGGRFTEIEIVVVLVAAAVTMMVGAASGSGLGY